MEMKVRTINGKTFDEVQKLLDERFELLVKDSTGNFLTPSIEIVEEKLNQILGLNYSFKLTKDPELVTLFGIPSYVGSGEIQLHDDEGNFVCSRSQGGGTNVVLIDVKDKFDPEGNPVKKPKDLSNDYKIAVTDIMKKCAQALGLGLYLLKEKNISMNKYVDTSNFNTDRGRGQNSRSTDGDQPVSLTGNYFVAAGAGRIAGRAFRLPVKDSSGRMGEFVLWESLFSNLGTGVLACLKNIKTGGTINADVTKDTSRNSLQFIVTKAESLKIA